MTVAEFKACLSPEEAAKWSDDEAREFILRIQSLTRAIFAEFCTTYQAHPQRSSENEDSAPARSVSPSAPAYSSKQNAPLLQITGMVSDSEGQKADCQKAERNLSC